MTLLMVILISVLLFGGYMITDRILSNKTGYPIMSYVVVIIGIINGILLLI